MFGQQRPLSLRAQLAFEQSYGEIDGDSASSSELFAVLGALADVGIDQGIAVTGSVNQLGEMQAIGGVCAKVEGFLNRCTGARLERHARRPRPDANLPHLVLRDDVAEALAQGQFHLYASRPCEAQDRGSHRSARRASATNRSLSGVECIRESREKNHRDCGETARSRGSRRARGRGGTRGNGCRRGEWTGEQREVRR